MEQDLFAEENDQDVILSTIIDGVDISKKILADSSIKKNIYRHLIYS